MAYTHEMGLGFWHGLDQATQYSPSFMALFGSSGAALSQFRYRDTRAAGTYPDAFLQFFLPRRDDWVRIAEVQSTVVAAHLGDEVAHLQGAFEDFGQGILLSDDPQRAADRNWIHMMDGQDDNPPIGYHRWHASIRAIQLLGIGDAGWWEELDRMVGLGWGVQSLARPRQQQAANPPIDQSDLQEVRDAWLALTPEQRNRQYDLTPQGFGFHPSPKLHGGLGD